MIFYILIQKNITQSITQKRYNFFYKKSQLKSLLMINILILEDDPIISLDIKAIIDDMDGFNSFIASNISDALKIAHKYILHIVLADIQIKGLIDGIDTAKTLQQLYHCQVIFLTSFNDEQTLQRASDLETSGYILKPFTLH